RAGGPGGVADDRDVVGRARGELGVEVAGVARVERVALLGELGQAHEPGLVVAAHAARIVVDHVPQLVAARPNAQQLVDLLPSLANRASAVSTMYSISRQVEE